MPPKLPAAIKTYYEALAAIEGAGAAHEGHPARRAGLPAR
jgi:hypothetical protein